MPKQVRWYWCRLPASSRREAGDLRQPDFLTPALAHMQAGPPSQGTAPGPHLHVGYLGHSEHTADEEARQDVVVSLRLP